MNQPNPWARAERCRKERIIPKPTLQQAYAHVRAAVAEADRRGIESPTIEAMRAILLA